MEATMTTIRLKPDYIGTVGDTGVYRLDLSEFPLSTVLAITVYDDNIISGGSGGASGMDLDFFNISSTYTSSASTAASLASSSLLNFGTSVSFSAGFMQPFKSGHNKAWNTTYLIGTLANAYDPFNQTLATRDAVSGGGGGSISLGEGGQITFLLNAQASTQGTYVYFGDLGSGNDAVYVSVSDERVAPSKFGLRLEGTSGDDNINLTAGVNAIGLGDDTINGSGGNDYIWSGSGTDTITGGKGNDILNGGEDTDTAVFSGARSAYTLNLTTTTGSSTVVHALANGDGIDTLYGIEFLKFIDQVVAILNPGVSRFGSAAADVLVSGLGDDVLTGGSGNDYFYARDGIDTIYGGDGVDVLLGEGGNDVLVGDADNDYLFGGNGNDTFYGGAGVDVIIAGAGDDLMFGGSEGDYFYGEAGNNVYYGDDGNDIMVGDVGDETFNGGNGNDYVYAGGGDDVINGGDGVDVLLGQGGSDIFDAGPGVDYLFLGAAGNDTVIINPTSGVQVVNEFAAGGLEDVVLLQAVGLGSFEDVGARLFDFGAFSVLSVDDDTAIWFIGVSASALTASDFLFG
jgi:Ca2+-binding RTX toxin-like protein